MMKRKNTILTDDQRAMVEEHLSIVHWILWDSIHIDPCACGLEYDDLFQEGFVWLCLAAAYDPRRSKFPTYAKKVVRNGLPPTAARSAARSAACSASKQKGTTAPLKKS